MSRPAPASAPLAASRIWLLSRPDGTILQWLFRTMLAATILVLGLDLVELRSVKRQEVPEFGPGGAPVTRDILPSVREGQPGPRDAAMPGDALSGPAAFELISEGRLLLTGAVEPGAAERFAEEIAQRGEYVRTVVLSSPGGSVHDALKIGRLIREREFRTKVEAGAYCASSCPLIFAAGVERLAGDGAAIGVHQVLSAGGAELTSDQGMDRAQRASAETQRYLIEMGVDVQVWIHAMETPPAELFYFSAEELIEFGLATAIAAEEG